MASSGVTEGWRHSASSAVASAVRSWSTCRQRAISAWTRGNRSRRSRSNCPMRSDRSDAICRRSSVSNPTRRRDPRSSQPLWSLACPARQLLERPNCSTCPGSLCYLRDQSDDKLNHAVRCPELFLLNERSLALVTALSDATSAPPDDQRGATDQHQGASHEAGDGASRTATAAMARPRLVARLACR